MDIKGLIYKTKWRMLRPQAFVAQRRLRANECKSLDELLAMQERMRQELVRCAYANSPFYRRLYTDAGFQPSDIGGEGWFERLPIVTKAHLRENYEEFFDPNLRQYARSITTGGSTGVPTRTSYDDRIPIEAYSWRQQEWFGVHPWEHHAYVWRDTRKSKVAQLKNACIWWPTRHLKLDATNITEDKITEFLSGYVKLRPALLYGYVGAITQLAQYVVDHGLQEKVRNPRLKFVWVTSAPLSPVQRRLISDAFGAIVCDQYGSCEIRGIAQQCPECRGLHVNVEHVHIEFVDDDNRSVPTGTYGRTLLTNLEEFVFPLIRYENGDRGRWLSDPCPCGRTLPCIDSVKGRESECFVLPNGGMLNGEFLTTIFDETPDLVHAFRVVQHKDLSITVEYVPNGDEAPVLKVLERFAATVKAGVPIDFKRVVSIPHDRGKLRFVVREKE